jgi:hypothetical protein
LEALILWPFEDLVAMETIERVGRVLTSDVVIKENSSASGVEVLKPSKVVNLTINDYPEVTAFVVLCNVVTGEFLELSSSRGRGPVPCDISTALSTRAGL